MRLLILLSLVIGIGATGCSSDREAGGVADLLGAPAATEGASMSTFVGSTGGSLSAGGAEVVIPPCAVDNGTTVTLEWDGASRCVVTVTGPPLQDDAVLRMQRPPGKATSAGLRIMGYDDVSGGWVDLGGDEANGRVEIRDRFVHYSIFDLDDID